MFITDKNGRWEINNKSRILIEPSELWISENRLVKTEEELQQELIEKYHKKVEELISENELYNTQSKREAIIRKKIANNDDKNQFDAFNLFVENTKNQVKEDLGME